MLALLFVNNGCCIVHGYITPTPLLRLPPALLRRVCRSLLTGTGRRMGGSEQERGTINNQYPAEFQLLSSDPVTKPTPELHSHRQVINSLGLLCM